MADKSLTEISHQVFTCLQKTFQVKNNTPELGCSKLIELTQDKRQF